MAVSRDPDKGTWTVQCYYRDWQGNPKRKHKRGFRTKHEALEYERNFLLAQSRDVNMSFGQFVECYLSDIRPRLKQNTFLTKQHIIETKILPYFENKSLAEINANDVLKWQNELLSMRDANGKAYAPTYLRTVDAQLKAIFNFAQRFYGLKDNPCSKAGTMGKSKAKEMDFWTLEEYTRFAETMKSKPVSYYAFELLYWTGIRTGELLALTRGDFDLDKRILTIDKSLQRLKGELVVTPPKTEKGNRTIDLPEFLCDEIEDYIATIYDCQPDTRLFEVSKSFLHHEMDRGVKESGVKRIRIHDLRHSHVAYLVNQGFSPVEIGARLGHESTRITDTYAHLYPDQQRAMAEKMNDQYQQHINGEHYNGEQ